MKENDAKEGKIQKTDAEWRRQLTPEQYHCTRQNGTEVAFTGTYWKTKTDGNYHCIGCGEKLFDAVDKFDSGTGWPSFTKPVSEGRVATKDDYSMTMQRAEILCSHCDAHLGHVFDDGPAPSGLRYCVNSASLNLKKR